MFYKKDGAGCIAIQKRLLPLQAERKAAAGAKLELLEQRAQNNACISFAKS